MSSLLIVLEDSWVQAKLTSFHADMANTFFGSIGMNRTSTIALPLPLSLEVPFFPIDPIFSRYSSCNESFPSIKLACIYSAACNHCSRDKREPKLYSAANSMDPGPVPPALQGLTQVEEMFISHVVPVMSTCVPALTRVVWLCSGHVINLPTGCS